MQQQYSNLFQNSLDFPTPIIAFCALFSSVILYHSIFINIFTKVIEQVFFAANDFTPIKKTYLYVCLSNLPFVGLILVSVFSNNSILGLEIALTIDQIYIYLVTGYICWIQESRHTPIRGIFFIRDLILAIFSLALLFDVYFSGNIGFDISSPLIAIFWVYHIIISYFEGVQDFILRGLGLKQSNNYNSKFLLTSKNVIPDFLQIKDIILEKKTDINEQLRDFKQILINLENNQEDQQILMNFAKLYLPIKKATQLKDKMDNQQVLNQISEQWDQISEQSESQSEEQEEIQKNISKNDSGDHITLNKDTYTYTYTYTQDFIVQSQKAQNDLNKYQKFLKYVFYPIYITKRAQGRLKFFVYLLSSVTMMFLMYLISNSSNYYETQLKSTSLISIIVGLLLIYPSASYYVQISAKNDYDFTNIFLLAMIIKVMVFGTGTLIYFLMISSAINFRIGSIAVLMTRIITLGVFLGFMVLKRFATRFSNFKFFVGLFASSCIARILAQNIIN